MEVAKLVTPEGMVTAGGGVDELSAFERGKVSSEMKVAVERR